MMKIHYFPPNKMLKRIHPEKHRQIAFHAAGQAAAIYLRNKRMELPSVFFRLTVKQSGNYEVNVDGGMLIKTLPTALIEVTKDFNREQTVEYYKAFAADIVNILAGPVAEAKYVSQRDNEIISPRLVNLNSLGFYHGSADLGKVLNYAKCLDLSPEDRQKTLIDLYLATYGFVNEQKSWNGITRLANHILLSEQDFIGIDEVAAVLDEDMLDNREKKMLLLGGVSC